MKENLMQNRKQSPSLEQWRRLYDSADALLKLAPWQWMEDSDLFGVQSPGSGTIGYMCIMGNARTHYAVAAYRGGKGLQSYFDIAEGNIDSLDAFYTQDCIMLSFEGRNRIEKQDQDIIERLERTYKGMLGTPVFRSYDPGYVPWSISAEDALFFADCIEQTLDVAARYKDNPDILHGENDLEYLVRVPAKNGSDNKWADRYLTADLPVKNIPDTTPTNEILIRRILKESSREGHTWEVDWFYNPTPVKEGKGRPYFPAVFVCIDQQTQMALGHQLVTPRDSVPQAYIQGLLSTMLATKQIPERIYVSKSDLENALATSLSELAVELDFMNELPGVVDLRQTMERMTIGGH
jgi:hypothetical protein